MDMFTYFAKVSSITIGACACIHATTGNTSGAILARTLLSGALETSCNGCSGGGGGGGGGGSSR